MTARLILISSLSLVLLACGDNGGSANGDGDGDGDGDTGDGGVNGDGGNADCTPGGTECSNCVDDDGDGRIDGADIHCTSNADDDESSFETGIPGDNVDLVKQDCFFDGNSGAGDDGCDMHICCLLGAADRDECEALGDSLGEDFRPNQFDPTECVPSSECIMECQPLTPPGCDCFSCCTLCVGTDCADVLTHPDLAPDCDADSLDDPALCPRCTKTTECENPCSDPCVLCPGQDESDLPPSCGGENTCTGDSMPCDTSDDCTGSDFCASGCCIGQVQ